MEKSNLIKSLTIQLAERCDMPILELQNVIANELCDYSVTKINSNLPATGDGSATYYIFKKFSQCKYNEGMQETSLRQYKTVIAQLFNISNKEITLCDEQDINDFLTYYRQRNLKSQTIRNKFLLLSSIFTFMYDHKYISDNPIRKIGTPKIHLTFEETISKDEEERIKVVCEKMPHKKSTKSLAIFNLLLDSGIRVTELCNINLSDVNFIQREIHIREGKGGKDRTVYFTEKTAVRLNEYLKTRDDIGEGKLIEVDTPLFKNYHNRRPNKSNIEVLLRNIGKLSGVSRLHPHLLRATFATRLVEKGVPLNIVAEMLGHSNLHTIDRYVRITKENKKYYYNMAS